MARTITFIDEDGYWYDTNTKDIRAWIKVSGDSIVIERRDTPKLSQRLRMAVKVLRRSQNATSNKLKEKD